MPLKQVNTTADFITLSDNIGDLISASISIELPLNKDEKIDYSDCIVVYFDYDYSNPFSKRTYKLFKYFKETSVQAVQKEFLNLGKLQGLYILLDYTENDADELIIKLNDRHISI